MPNWCNNNLTVSSDNPELIEHFKMALDSNGLFQYLKPNPTGDWSYSWSVENWGVKWDVDGDSINVVQLDEDRIIIEFDTAWGPPIEFYKHLENLGFDVTGMYYEPGMCFCGIYNSGFDEYFEYGDMTHEEVKASIPDELDECFMISERIEEMKDEND
ncbi:MAG: hypothetical protein EB127_00795 [Alphaproteobacteria bacterium]|nr:hypothetical protein [Alphaproteobacteria bacterium]